jgi:hypothetical protein
LRAARSRLPDPDAAEGPAGPLLPEADLVKLREDSMGWSSWRDASGWAAVGVFAASLLVLVNRRDRWSIASFLGCLVLTLVAVDAWNLLF